MKCRQPRRVAIKAAKRINKADQKRVLKDAARIEHCREEAELERMREIGKQAY